MNSRNRTNLPPEDQHWDGFERRDYDRQHYQPQYYQQPQYSPQYSPVQQSMPVDTKNVAQTTLTLQQLGGIIVVVGSVLLSGFSAWSNLNRELDDQKINFDQFKVQISKDVDDVQQTVKDLKKINEDMKLQNQKSNEALDHRIQDLDATVTQIYQKVSSK